MFGGALAALSAWPAGAALDCAPTRTAASAAVTPAENKVTPRVRFMQVKVARAG